MRNFKIVAVANVMLATAGVTEVAASSENNPAMLDLARQSGCLTCHAIEAGGAGDSAAKPIGPAWQDVAKKYLGHADAAEKLTATVMQGSNPYASHWKGKVTGLAMPPNAVAITRPQAHELVNWILSLAAK